ncbi:stalk domain-containing protein, partial [Herbivorax sp. ANBcel31]|uniref:stalk domain-containing protein n=1 Tax=Herbivorax sp. ANBcel31 TaxID=3069754 RepID=UPI0027AFDBF1
MKKITLTLALMLIITTILSTNILAFEVPLRVLVDGSRIDFPDALPFIDSNGRTQVPVRFVSEALGADV